MEPHICYLCIYTPFGVLAFFLRSTKQDGLNVQKRCKCMWALILFTLHKQKEVTSNYSMAN